MCVFVHTHTCCISCVLLLLLLLFWVVFCTVFVYLPVCVFVCVCVLCIFGWHFLIYRYCVHDVIICLSLTGSLVQIWSTCKFCLIPYFELCDIFVLLKFWTWLTFIFYYLICNIPFTQSGVWLVLVKVRYMFLPNTFYLWICLFIFFNTSDRINLLQNYDLLSYF